MQRPIGCLLLAALLAAGAGCGGTSTRAELRLRVRELASAEHPGPGDHWVLPPDRLEHRLMHQDFMIRRLEELSRGMNRPSRATLFFPGDGLELDVKWKALPPGKLDSWTNAPRKELAAYALQQWFLDPEDYVVPTAALRCVPIERYRVYFPYAEETLEGTGCVLGVVSVWLKDVKSPEQIYDEERFLGDPAYAYHLANFNLLAYLIDHRDSHTANVLVSSGTANRHVFSVDNDLAFGSRLHNFFRTHWNVIRVPALRRDAIDRLRRLTRSDLDRLGVVAEMQAGSGGILELVTPGANLAPQEGARIGPDPFRIQLGLTRAEIDGIEERIRKILLDVGAGRILVF